MARFECQSFFDDDKKLGKEHVKNIQNMTETIAILWKKRYTIYSFKSLNWTKLEGAYEYSGNRKFKSDAGSR